MNGIPSYNSETKNKKIDSVDETAKRNYTTISPILTEGSHSIMQSSTFRQEMGVRRRRRRCRTVHPHR